MGQSLSQYYWEVWPVPPNSTMPSTKIYVTFMSGGDPNKYGNILTANGFAATDTVDDIFSSRAIQHQPGVAGAVIMRGSLWYIDGSSNLPSGFEFNPNSAAGLIPILTATGDGGNYRRGIIDLIKRFRKAAASGTLSEPVQHAAIATWDNTGATTLSTFPAAGDPNVNTIDDATLTNLYAGKKISLFKSQVKVFGAADDTTWFRGPE